RLVVDTGIHAKGWTRQQAIDFFLDNAAKTELDIVNEIDRYIGNPGQALAYKIGQLKISELRARAETRLGERFDIRAFHDHLLGAGALPLDVLERRMDAWIRQQARAERAARAPRGEGGSAVPSRTRGARCGHARPGPRRDRTSRRCASAGARARYRSRSGC